MRVCELLERLSEHDPQSIVVVGTPDDDEQVIDVTVRPAGRYDQGHVVLIEGSWW